jgi:hypothetical protein
MFSPEERTRVRERVIELARTDDRITGGAVTGSRSVGAEDRWSDIDLSFGVRNGVELNAVLADWTAALERELGVLHHWDLISGPTTYRVFLLPGGLELDVALTPAADFGAHGPKFQLQFGQSVERPTESPMPDEDVGYGWLYALNARAAIERDRVWAAEHWISGVRDQALALACSRLGEPADHARGIHRLPPDVVAPYQDALVRSLDVAELRRALTAAVDLFLGEVAALQPELAARLRGPLTDADAG